MLRINLIDGVNFHKANYQTQPTFKGEERNQVNSLPSCNADYNVRKPTSYVQTGVVNLPNDFKAHCYKLENGQQVVIVPKANSPTLVKTYVNTGSLNESDNVRGISHYIEHNLFNGSEGLEAGEFFATTDKMGASTNATTNFAETDYFIQSNLLNDGDLEKKIKIHASMLETPKFAVEALEKEKGIVNSEINMYQGYADVVAVNLTLKKLFGINSTSTDLIAGTAENINRITREDVIDYYNNNYYPANMVTVITGDVNPDEAISLISKHFKGTNKNTHPRKFEKLTPTETTVRQDIYSDKTVATRMVVGFSGPKNDDMKSKICISMISSILNAPKTGRLDKALKPYNTSALLGIEKISCRPQDPTAVFLETQSNEKDSQNVIQEIFNQIYSISADPSFDEELQAIKKHFIMNNNLKYEKSSRLNEMIGSAILNNRFDAVVDYENIVNSITKEDIIKTANEYLNLNKAVVTVVHPEQKQVSFTGNNTRKPLNTEDIKHYKLTNNAEIVTCNSKTDLAALNLSIKMDSIPNANPTAQYILSKIYSEGSIFRDADAFNKDLMKDAIDVDCAATSRAVHSFAKCSPQDIQKTLNSTLEVLYNPRFTQETFETVKKDFVEKLQRQEKSPYDKLNKELFKGYNLSYTNQDLIEAANKLTLEEVKNLHSQILSNGSLYVAVSAPFNKNPQLKNNIFNTFGYLPMFKPSNPTVIDMYKPIEQTKVLTEVGSKEQAEVIEAYKFKLDGNMKDVVSIKLMNMILGGNSSSRLFNDLREKQQLAYSVDSSFTRINNIGVMELSIGTTTENEVMNQTSYDNIQKSIDGFNKHINKIKTEYVSEEELENAKLQLKNRLLSANETMLAKNASLISGMDGFYGELEKNKIIEMLDSITVQDIYNAANYVFAGKPTYSILAKENTLKANEEYFKTLV